MKKYILYFILFFAIILFFTHGLFGNFFQQDEWGAFGDIIYSYNQPWWIFLISKGVHFNPLGLYFWLILYKVFVLNSQYYVLIELLMHALATLLVFIFTSKISKNNRIGFLTATLFATNGRAYEAFMHLAIFSTTISSFIFIVLFFIYLASIKEKYFAIKNIFILFGLFLCSVLFREDGFIIVPLLVVYLLTFDREKLNGRNIKAFMYLAVGLFLFLIIRVVSQAFNIDPIPKESSFDFNSVIYNLLSLPIKLVVQNLISAAGVFNLLINKTSWAYPSISVSFVQAYPVFMDLAFISLFSVIVWIFAASMFFWKNKDKLKYIIFFSCWILLNAIILSFAGRNLNIVDERYLYLSSVPVLFFTSLFIVFLFSSSGKFKVADKFKKVVAVIILVLLFYSSYSQIQAAVKYKVTGGYARRTFLNNVKAVHPSIPNNTIFYIVCKVKCYRNSEFGLSPDWVLPFSSGAGWNILVKYSVGNETTWGKFLNHDFLLNLNSQGYRRIGDRSFGYFTDIGLLKNVLKENKLSSGVVIALEYNEQDFSVKDISKKVRQEL